MNHTRYHFTLSINHPDFGGRTAAAVILDREAHREILRPMDHVPDPMTAYVVGAPTLRTVKETHAARERLAKELAVALTERILRDFGSKDTRNGYPQ